MSGWLQGQGAPSHDRASRCSCAIKVDRAGFGGPRRLATAATTPRHVFNSMTNISQHVDDALEVVRQLQAEQRA